MKLVSFACMALVLIWVGYQLGWMSAHKMVAVECERLGAFFVGKRVYKCVEIATAPEDTTDG